MKNLPPISELKERIRRQSERTAWLRADVESYLTAEAVQEGLGAWPKRLAKTDVEFDPDEERSYGDVPGGKLSGLAARIVLTAKDEWRFLKVLRGVAEAMIAPLVAYLRVNLAMTKLEETINNIRHSGPLFASKQKTGMTDKGKKKKPPAFKWSQSPRAAYGFAEAKAAYGFDPRDTSVYWIEKRAARLRRKWARYERENLPLEPSFESPGCARPQDEERGGLPGAEGASRGFPDEPDIPVRHFVPADADYNTIWPPIELPDGPPEPSRSMDQSIDGAHDSQAVTPEVMREASPLDGILLDGADHTPSNITHDGERQHRPSKQGEGMQSPDLKPSCESRDCVPPQDEECDILPEGGEFPAFRTQHVGDVRNCSSKHGKESLLLEPSLESPGVATGKAGGTPLGVGAEAGNIVPETFTAVTDAVTGAVPGMAEQDGGFAPDRLLFEKESIDFTGAQPAPENPP